MAESSYTVVPFADTAASQISIRGAMSLIPRFRLMTPDSSATFSMALSQENMPPTTTS